MISQTPGPGEELKAGHHWKEADRVTDYIQQNDVDTQHITEAFEVLTSVLPFAADAPHLGREVRLGEPGVVEAAKNDDRPLERAG